MYCQPEDVRSLVDDPDIPSVKLLAIIPDVSEGIDNWCHRTFAPQTKVRMYDYTGEPTIKLREELISITSVITNADQVFGSSDFILLPNDDPPYYWIKLKQGMSFSYSGSPEQAISINGSWGYQATVPKGVVLGATIWTGILYNHLDQLGFESIKGGDLSASLKELTAEPPNDVQVHINRYRRIRVGSV